MNDKQALQKMRKLTKDTHWIQGALSRIIEWEKTTDSQGGIFCRTDENGDYIPGKIGYCIMGMVGFVTGAGLIEGNDYPAGLYPGTVSDTEYKLKSHPQATRITEILWDNLPLVYRDDGSSTIYDKAMDCEKYNDNPARQKGEILAWLDRCIENYKPKRSKK